MPVSSSQAVRHFDKRQRQAIEIIDVYEDLAERCDRELAGIAGQLERALVELAGAYLPSFDPAALADAERLTGFRGFSRRSPLDAMKHEEHVLRSTIARIEADERYVKRELLVGPQGNLINELAEARDMLAPFEAECARFEVLPGFLELVMVKYDTPDFGGKWYQASYWKHWAAGDKVCAALGMDDFGDDVLPAYTKVADQRDVWRRDVARIEDLIRQVHELVRAHDQSLARIPALPQLYYDQSLELLAEHLGAADVPLLDQWVRAEPTERRAIRMALRRVSGLKAKRDVIEELRRDGIRPLVDDLRRRAHKYARKSQKFARPKYAYQQIPDNALDHKFDAKYAKLRERESKLGVLIDRIVRYDDYHRFDLDNDADLWWFEFTNKRPTRMTPKLRRWYERHPDARPHHETWDDRDDGVSAAVAAAAVAHELDDVGYIS